MKKDKITEIKWNRETGEISGDQSTLELIRDNPVRDGYGVAVSWEASRPDDCKAHGLKRMPKPRTLADGRITGQVYLMGSQWRGEVFPITLPNGESSSVIGAELPDTPEPEVFTLPIHFDPARPCWPYPWRGFFRGIPAEAFAFQIGCRDLDLARDIQAWSINAFREHWRKIEGRVKPAEFDSRPVIPPLGFKAPLPKIPRLYIRNKWLADDNGKYSWREWRKRLGWSGWGSCYATVILANWVFSGGTDDRTLGIIDFPSPEPGTPEWEQWVV